MRALILLLFLVIAAYIIWVAIPKKSRRTVQAGRHRHQRRQRHAADPVQVTPPSPAHHERGFSFQAHPMIPEQQEITRVVHHLVDVHVHS